MDNKEQFKPFIPAEKIVPEMTAFSIIMGAILAVIFGAANAYLGLRVGMTVSASIPAAVISMGVIRVILHRDSILENNFVQTVGSAGESLAAGAIFTLPAMFLWAKDGLMEKPNLVEIMIICLIGGLLCRLYLRTEDFFLYVLRWCHLLDDADSADRYVRFRRRTVSWHSTDR